MHPITLEYLGKSRMQDLHREAAQDRLANQAKSSARKSNRLRAAGRWFISLGHRVAPAPAVRSTKIAGLAAAGTDAT